MKLCKDCKHAEGHYDYKICVGPHKTIAINLVTGIREVSGEFCKIERDAGRLDSWLFNACGKEGRHFEMKEAA